ncbi:lipocalin-like domain-containing protein [Vibrio hannami]|uniref:lipocalin-like domain-containing protein n=1 Tax=Vibrio hannami TaxID=2717094 RepID=UPI00240F643E|nr:lipocalin-like domain-containing protein [Vibrio hannami]MDG3087463.1 lipocalin-like domain-containing protein [Vibrio hannami]
MDNNLIGTWGLKRFTLADEKESDIVFPFGGDPEGQLIYTQDGFMSVALHSSNRAPFASDDILSGTPKEFEMAMQTYSTYAGRIVIKEPGKLLHVIEHSLFPNWVGHSEEREYTVEGDTLTLKTPPFFIAGAERVGTVVFERQS